MVKTGRVVLFLALAAGVLTSCIADAPPQNVVASAGNGQATVSWSAAPGKSGEITIGYNVMAIVGSVAQSPVRFDSTSTTQVISDLTNGVTYRFAVQAISVNGTSAWSTASSPVTPFGCAGTLFSEDFSDNSAGWTPGPEWQIGSATASTGQMGGFPDPSADHTATSDNGVAGAVIGGNPTVGAHAPYYFTSPPIDTTGRTSLTLDFWRWLNSDYPPYSTWTVEAWDGAAWAVVLSNTGAGAVTSDLAWTQVTVNLTPYLNPAFMVRFSHSMGSGAFVMSGWNIDDIALTGNCA